ncbi:hypothetical protein MPER_00811, partial [Moniliophthora perniciosa FA553]
FAVAVKHHIRGEAGIYFDDLYDLVKPLHPESLTIHTFHFDTVTNLSHPEVDLSPVIDAPLIRAVNSKTTNVGNQRASLASTLNNKVKSPIQHVSDKWRAVLPPKPRTRTHKQRPVLPGTGGGANLPLEILRCLSEWMSVLEERGTVPGTSMGSLMGCVATFEDSLGTLEKRSYQAHPIATFIYQGFVTAGKDLEHPFGAPSRNLTLNFSEEVFICNGA